MAESSLNTKKILWEKFVMSNFSFSYNVFIGLVLQTRENHGLFGKGLKKKKKNQQQTNKKQKKKKIFNMPSKQSMETDFV